MLTISPSPNTHTDILNLRAPFWLYSHVLLIAFFLSFPLELSHFPLIFNPIHMDQVKKKVDTDEWVLFVIFSIRELRRRKMVENMNQNGAKIIRFTGIEKIEKK
jgi:hypothetical protein